MSFKINNLVKNYGDFCAVNDISLEINDGEFFAFLGPNGAGKSTTINVISSLLNKTSGEVYLNDISLDDDASYFRKNIGVVFQHSVLDSKLTVKENLMIRGALYGMNKDDIITRLKFFQENIELDSIMNKRYGKLSGGQKRRVDICRALLLSPKFLILDEPTTGLDPQTRLAVWKFISKIRKIDNITIFLTTHYMEESEAADRVAIIDEGKIVAMDTPYQLKVQYASDLLILYPKDMEQMTQELLLSGLKYKIKLEQVDIDISEHTQAIELLNKYSHLIDNFEMLKGTMDTVFLNITGKAIREN